MFDYLVKHPLRYMTATQLVHGAWGGNGLREEQLRTYLVRLRKVIKNLGLPCQLVNRPRRGYSLVF